MLKVCLRAAQEASSFLTRFCSGAERTAMPRRLRLRFRDLQLARWRLHAREETTFPVAVILQRFDAALWVFFLGIADSV